MSHSRGEMIRQLLERGLIGPGVGATGPNLVPIPAVPALRPEPIYCDFIAPREKRVLLGGDAGISIDDKGLIYRCDVVPAGEPVSIPDKLETGDERETSSHLFDGPRSLDARIAELHLDVLATADEMRAELARQSRAFQTMITALVVVCALLVLLSLKLVGGGQ